jgi:hypothetical protein
MTEVVTSTAAASQLNLLAQRQQVFGVERPVVERQSVDAGFTAADLATAATADTSVDSQQQKFSDKQEDQNPVNRHSEQPAPRAEQVTGPSKPRVEIKHIDLGLTPSEVVGTPDVLQRFDTNGDGRVDLAEAARAGVAREGVFTYAGLAGQTSDAATAVAGEVAVETEENPRVGAPTAAPAGTSEVVEKKLYAAADVPAAQSRRHFVQAAAEGGSSGVAEAPKKFSGQGAEVVVGRFAAEPSPKIADKAVTKQTTTVSEDGSGEEKIYDKVAQAETDTGNAEQQPQHDPTQRQAAQVAAYHAAAAAAAVKAAVKALTA